MGPHHPEVAIRLNNLAQLLKDTNRLAEAEPLMTRPPDRRGLLRPSSAGCRQDLDDLAYLLRDTEHLEEAIPLVERSIEIYSGALVPSTPRRSLRAR